MSEPKVNYMSELDLWSEANIIGPLFTTDATQEDWEVGVDQVKKAIRTKVLESYRNGQASGPTKAYRRR